MTVEIEGMDNIRRMIDQLKDLKPAKAALKAGGVHIKGKIAQYPPSSEANVPNQRRWYQRGWGSKWMLRDGTVHGRKTSETLGRKWTVQTRDAGLTVVVGNNVSYGPYVQDADHQAPFHKARGWKTAQEVVKEESPTVVKFIEDELEKALK